MCQTTRSGLTSARTPRQHCPIKNNISLGKSKKNKETIFCQTIRPVLKDVFFLCFPLRQKSGLNRKSNFFFGNRWFWIGKPTFLRNNQKLLLATMRPKTKMCVYVCVCVILWFSLGNFNVSQQSHLFLGINWFSGPKPFFRKKCWYFGAKPRQQQSFS